MNKKEKIVDRAQSSALHIGDVMGWRFFKDNEENLRSIPKDRDIEILFDDGTILQYSDEDWPFAEVIAWREIDCP